jgi:hypothetical protein
MANSISSVTTGTGGIVLESVDTSGNTNIKSGTTTIVAVSSTGAAVTGTLSASGGIAKASLPTGSVLQVVNAAYSTQVTNSSTTYADTNLTATITPSSATSKILVLVSQRLMVVGGAAVGYGYQTDAGLQLLRDATVLVTSNSDSGGKYSIFLSTGVAPSSGIIGISGIVALNYLDSPASTSALVYKTQCAKGTSGMGDVYANNGTNQSTITLMEIAA